MKARPQSRSKAACARRSVPRATGTLTADHSGDGVEDAPLLVVQLLARGSLADAPGLAVYSR